MLYSGFVTDGEWNSLRSKGIKRPLSIFEIRAQVCRKYSRLSVKIMTDMLTPKGIGPGSCVIMSWYYNYFMRYQYDSIAELSGGLIQALHPNPAVSQDVLKEVYACLNTCLRCSMEDVIVRRG